MRYEVHVAPHSGGQATRFEHEQEEPLKPGDPIRLPGMSYRVESVTPLSPEESDEFDARVKAVWVAGPVTAGYRS
jgi:hypothetical protein